MPCGRPCPWRRSAGASLSCWAGPRSRGPCPCVAVWRWSCAAAFRPGRPACRGWCCRRGRGRMRDASSCLRRGRARRRCLRVACWSPVCRFVPAAASLSGDGHDARRRHPHYKEASSASRCRFPSDGSCPYQRSGASRVRRQHPPDHGRQGDSAIPHSATGSRGAGPTNQCNGHDMARVLFYSITVHVFPTCDE